MFARTNVAPREATLECGGQRHTIRCEAGRLVLVDHPGDRDADEVLVALSGRPARCRAIEEAWHRLGHERALELLGAAGARGLVALNARPRGSRRAVRTARRRFRGSDATTP